MDIRELVATTRDALTARRVFGEPYERDGVTVIPAAVLRGGVGAYIVRGGTVRWRPAFDVKRTVGVAGTVAVVWLLTAGRRRAPGEAR